MANRHNANPQQMARRVAASAKATVKTCTLVADHRPGSACNNRPVAEVPVTCRLEQKHQDAVRLSWGSSNPVGRNPTPGKRRFWGSWF